ncbi:calcium/sodium antiporter [Afifella aestuarii]|uniref:calcium/sodium antiporter n=1 Tax=Afifella aestuarii TaxID=1909496 RepID=UPI0013E37BA4|nr:calcium/sodium antiporter [Afifella aestuarii]
MSSLLTLIAGLIFLMIAADILVRGSVSLAERFRVPPLVVGLTIIALGTSAPELVVSLQAGLAGSGGIAIGNVVGSNIANILLCLGLPSLIFATAVNATGLKRNFSVMVAATVLLIVLCWDGTLSRLDGGILLLCFIAFFVAQILVTRDSRRQQEEIEELRTNLSPALAALMAIGGLAALPFAADFVVEGAIGLAEMLGLSETVIGVTVVAVGTSLPELAAGIMSAWRGHSDMTLGNAIGSNIFNILFILGVTASAVPLVVPPDFLHYEFWAMVAAALVLVPFLGMRWPIGRLGGLILVLFYGGLIWGAVALPGA